MSASISLKALHTCFNTPLDGANLRSVFLLLTRLHYSEPKNYGDLEAKLGCFKYSDDKADSTIAVELSQEYDLSKGSVRPAVFVGMDSGLTFKKTDVAHKSGQAEDNSFSDTSHIAVMGLNIIHVASTMDEALLLAESSASFYIGIREAIMDRLGLLSFVPIAITAPHMMEASPERYFRVDTTFSLSYNYVVRVNIESHRLKKFAMELNFDES